MSIHTYTEGTLGGCARSPETINRRSGLAHLVVGGQKPEAKDGLGEDVQNGVGDNFAVNTNNAGTVSNTPDAVPMLVVRSKLNSLNINLHWVQGPEKKSESSNGRVESTGLVVLGGNSASAVLGQLVDNNQVGNAGNGIPSPLLTISVAKGSKETGQDHDDIGHDGNQNAGAVETGKQTEVEKQERSGQSPLEELLVR
jgi:hypothetical protein